MVWVFVQQLADYLLEWDMIQRNFQWALLRQERNEKVFLVLYVGFQLVKKEYLFVLLQCFLFLLCFSGQ